MHKAPIAALVLAVACVAGTPDRATSEVPANAATKSVPLRGTLTQDPGQPPALVLPDHRRIVLEGDDPTRGVLKDARLKGADFEAIGHFVSADHFKVDGMETQSLYVYKNSKRLMVTYWCNVCYIRTYTPGRCWCCQKYTDLDLIDPAAQ